MISKKVIISNLIALFLLYFNIVLTFSWIFMLLDYYGWGPIIDHYSTHFHQDQWLDRFSRSFYFSAITLLSVGYGDVTPFGISKAVAILEAMIGYILPVVLMIKYILFPAPAFKKMQTNKRSSQPY